MKRLLSELENNEAILQMYLAGELPEADRAEVQQMLASDSALRVQLEEVRSAQEAAFTALRDLDAGARPAMTPALARLQIGSMIEEWTQERMRPATIVLPANSRAIPWWRYTLSAAAALLFGYYVWTVYHIKPMTELPSLAQLNQPPAPQFPFAYGPAPADDYTPLTDPAPPRALTSDEKAALLSSSLTDSISDESPNVHVAELAAIIPSGAGGPAIDADSVSDPSGGVSSGGVSSGSNQDGHAGNSHTGDIHVGEQ
jgi:hypothetical protein